MPLAGSAHTAHSASFSIFTLTRSRLRIGPGSIISEDRKVSEEEDESELMERCESRGNPEATNVGRDLWCWCRVSTVDSSGMTRLSDGDDEVMELSIDGVCGDDEEMGTLLLLLLFLLSASFDIYSSLFMKSPMMAPAGRQVEERG